MTLKSICKTLLIACTTLLFLGCSSLPTYVTKPGNPVASLKVYSVTPSMCKDGIRYLLDVDRQTGLVTIPAGETIMLTGFQLYQGRHVTHTCSAALNFTPQEGGGYIIHGDLRDRQCFIELVKSDPTQITGVAIEPSVRPGSCSDTVKSTSMPSVLRDAFKPQTSMARPIIPSTPSTSLLSPALRSALATPSVARSVAPPATPVAVPVATPPVALAEAAPIAPPVATPVTQPAPSANAIAPAGSEARQGTWSYEVEKLASAQGCDSQSGALLVAVNSHSATEQYRVQCSNGKHFSAICDKLECKQN